MKGEAELVARCISCGLSCTLLDAIHETWGSKRAHRYYKYNKGYHCLRHLLHHMECMAWLLVGNGLAAQGTVGFSTIDYRSNYSQKATIARSSKSR